MGRVILRAVLPYSNRRRWITSAAGARSMAVVLVASVPVLQLHSVERVKIHSFISERDVHLTLIPNERAWSQKELKHIINACDAGLMDRHAENAEGVGFCSLCLITPFARDGRNKPPEEYVCGRGVTVESCLQVSKQWQGRLRTESWAFVPPAFSSDLTKTPVHPPAGWDASCWRGLRMG
jgi:hypothetical protein